MSKKKKQLSTVVDDIYDVISNISKGKALDISDDMLNDFGTEMATALREWAIPRGMNKANVNSLRMSNIGKPDRRLWFDMNATKQSKEAEPSLMIKFLYGHLLEVLVLFFVKLAGHEVTAEQKEVSVSGIKGHMDCKIDGEVVDVKTTSGFAFKKFKEGTLAQDDSFGYLAQLAGYEEAEGTTEGGFLALNKETGELALYRPEDLDKPNIKQRIKHLKKVVVLDKPPVFCYPTVAEGKAGNMKLAKECHWCPYKHECHKDSNDGNGLRIFEYAKGHTYLTKVVKTPNVQEVL